VFRLNAVFRLNGLNAAIQLDPLISNAMDIEGLDEYGGYGRYGAHGGDHESGIGGMRCSMNMLFNWNITNTCVIFSWWRINSIVSLLLSMLILFALAAAYEWLRQKARIYDEHIVEIDSRIVRGSSVEEGPEEEILLIGGRARDNGVRLTGKQQLYRSFLYATLVGFSFFLMLVFMTYNGYIMLSVVAGAGTGFFFFSKDNLGPTKGMQCH
jgi:copper transporter 1